MVSVRSVLSKETHNECQKFDGLLTVPQLRNTREMILGMLLGESSCLSTIGHAIAGNITPRKNTERYSRTLEQIDPARCTQQHIACVAQRFHAEPVLLLVDGGDMQKPHAKVMKHVCPTVDGSEGHTPGRGYPTFACIAYGLRTEAQIPLFHHLYSTVHPDFKSAWEEQKTCMQWCMPLSASPHDRIVVEDRGGDDEKHILFYAEEMQWSFVTRVKCGEKSRNLCPVRREEIQEAVSVKEIASQVKGAAGAAKKWKHRKLRKTLSSSIAFQEVRLPDHPELPLYLVCVFTEGFDEPMVLITDIAVKDAEEAWTIFFYYKRRWEVENFFRAIKQNFGGEKFLILSFPAIRALAFIQMLAFSLLRKMHAVAQDIFAMLFHAFQAFCRRWQREETSALTLLQWMQEQWQNAARTGMISYRAWSQHMRRCLKERPESQDEDFSPPQKW